jgi:catalase
LTFRFKAQLAAAGDSTKDPSKPWPDDRKLVELGVLTIDKAVTNSDKGRRSSCSCRANSQPGSSSPTIQ